MFLERLLSKLPLNDCYLHACLINMNIHSLYILPQRWIIAVLFYLCFNTSQRYALEILRICLMCLSGYSAEIDVLLVILLSIL